jgi:hypothetical protein
MILVTLSTSAPSVFSHISANRFANVIFIVMYELMAILAISALINEVLSIGGLLTQIRLYISARIDPAFESLSPIKTRSGSRRPLITSLSAINSGL